MQALSKTGAIWTHVAFTVKAHVRARLDRAQAAAGARVEGEWAADARAHSAHPMMILLDEW